MQNQTPSRAGVLELVRLNYVCQSIAGICDIQSALFEREGERGSYVTHDGSGNYDLFAWDENGLLAGSFDRNGPAPGDADPETKHPRQCWPDVPSVLEPLVERVLANTFEGLLTGGLWLLTTAPKTGGYRTMGSFTTPFRSYGVSPAEAMFGRTQNWQELYELSKERADLALELAAASAQSTITMTAAQVNTLLTLEEWREELDEVAFETLRARLGAVGIEW